MEQTTDTQQKRGIAFFINSEGNMQAIEKNLTSIEALALLNFATQYAAARSQEILLDARCIPLPPALTLRN